MLWLAVSSGMLTLVCIAVAAAFLLRGIFPQQRPLQYARWLFESGKYKREVLAQTVGPNQTLKHVEWDGWGWGGNDTTVYLVFDPNDALAHAASDGLSGNTSVFRARFIAFADSRVTGMQSSSIPDSTGTTVEVRPETAVSPATRTSG